MGALLLVLLGLSVIVGATGMAKRLATLLIALILVMTVLPALWPCCTGWADHGGQFVKGAEVVALALALAALGAYLWHHRADADRRHDARRLAEKPRQRALPPAPGMEDRG